MFDVCKSNHSLFHPSPVPNNLSTYKRGLIFVIFDSALLDSVQYKYDNHEGMGRRQVKSRRRFHFTDTITCFHVKKTVFSCPYLSLIRSIVDGQC